MNLPLFKSPGTVLFLDDDPDFLEMMALVIPPSLPVRIYLTPRLCIAQLQAQQAHREADDWQKQDIVDRWLKYRAPLIPQILRYWAGKSPRYELAQVLVVDYSMPAMSGMQVLQALRGWPGMRVLLTGQADEQLAVDAFNSGLIQQFIPKQSPDMVGRLVAAISRLVDMKNMQINHVWRSTLTPRQHALLSYPSIENELRQWVERHWVEYALIGAPFGVLGRDAAGQVGWLQLEPASGLEELADMAEASGTGHGALEEIRHGRQLSDVEMRQSFGRPIVPESRAAFTIGNDEPLFAALFPLGPEYDDKDSSYQRFLDNQASRTLQA